jgi:hypothetical protein
VELAKPRARTGAADCKQTPRLSGTILQPDLVAKWSVEQWQAEFLLMKEACLKQVVLQWTADSTNSSNKTTIYPTQIQGYKQKDGYADVVANLFAAADDTGVDVYLGLQTNQQWDLDKPAVNKAWYDREEKDAADLANELVRSYQRSRGFGTHFKGWYLSFEVDNFYFNSPTERANLIEFYNSVGTYLHKLSPSKPVVVAPFFNSQGGAAPAEWKEIWVEILTKSPLDIVALQDGVGAFDRTSAGYHATTAQLPEWFHATVEAIAEVNSHTKRNVQLWCDAETYIDHLLTTYSCNPQGATVFRDPLPIKTLVEDMRAVQPYVSNFLSFSFNHYDSPRQRRGAFYKTYLEYTKSGTIDAAPPSAPANVVATVGGDIEVRLNWTASADNLAVAGYKIYQDDKLIAVTYRQDGDTCTNFRDMEPSIGTPNYRVSAFDAAGNESAKSASVAVTTQDLLFNIAVGKSYTASMPADPTHPDEGGAGLTDTCLGEVSTYGGWQGRNTNQRYSFTIDLGAETTIGAVSSEWLQKRGDFVFLPKSVNYQTSPDNAHFEDAGRVAQPAAGDCDGTYAYRLDNLNKVGRYVRVEVEPGSAWSMISEVEVRGQ